MKVKMITIDNKRFAILNEIEYRKMLQDIADLKKVLERRNEKGIEAKEFFKNLKTAKR